MQKNCYSVKRAELNLIENKRILIVWTGDWPWDVRIEKEVKTLQNAGYKVSICARNTKNLNTFEKVNDTDIYRFSNFFQEKYSYK